MIDEDEPHTMTHIHSPSESRKIDSGPDVTKATCNEISLTQCLTIETDNIENSKKYSCLSQF